MRCYLAGTVADLTSLVSEPGTPHRALASLVTPALRAALPQEDEEGLEMSAYLTAADLSVLRIAASSVAPANDAALDEAEVVPPLRVVLTVEVGPSALSPQLNESGTEQSEEASALADELPSLAGTVTYRLRDVVALHVDDPQDDAAAALVRDAAGGDEAALDALAEIDLLWFAPEEIEDVSARLSGA